MNLAQSTDQNPLHFKFPEVRVVEASAGSGKTYALAKRYIQLVLHPDLPQGDLPTRHILALTFTNKAAFEMKARIMEFLKKIALHQVTDTEVEALLTPIGLTRDEASQKAFRMMDALIHQYNFFQVQTIDKFINALLSGCAFKIGLTANFKIKTNAAEYIQYSLDQLIDQAAEDPELAKLFDAFIHQYLYLENRTGWFPKEDMLSITHALFAQNNAYGFMFQVGPVDAQEILKLKKNILKQLKGMRQELPEGTHAGFLKSYDRFLEQYPKSFDVDALPKYFSRLEVPLTKGQKASAALFKSWEYVRDQIQLLCEYEALSTFNPYVEIYQNIMGGLRERAAKDDVLFLSELNKRACSLFDDHYVTVEELYYRLAARFQHYLIDEFQDTSQLQWHNLEKMVEEALSSGGSLFYVGDQKQAIYGFRGGKAELFDQVREKFQAFNIQPELLTRNWRSQKAIVDFNNQVFGEANLTRFTQAKEDDEAKKKKRNRVLLQGKGLEDMHHIFASAHQSHLTGRDDGYVEVQYVDIQQKEERDEWTRAYILDTIQELTQRFVYADIAILTRSNTQVGQVTQWLLEEHIPVESERTSHIQEHLLIEDVVAFLTFLHSPIDNSAFARFLLSPLFQKAAGRTADDMQHFLFQQRNRLQKDQEFYLYTEFRRSFPDIWENLCEDFFQNVGLYPLYELVVSFYHKFDCLKHFPEDQGYFMHFLELIKAQESEHSDLASFLDYFQGDLGESAFVHITDNNAIQVLTIHKSKGLQFPVVLVPFFGMHIQVGASDVDHKRSFLPIEQPPVMKLLRMKSNYYDYSEQLFTLYSQEYRKALISELNNMYVALTRAEKEMYVCIPKKIRNSFNDAFFLIPEDEYVSGTKKAYVTNKAMTPSITPLPLSPSYDWIAFLNDEFQAPAHLRRRLQRRVGEYRHFLLSELGNLSQESIDVLLDRAEAKARLRFSEDVRALVPIREIKHMIEETSLKSFFYTQEANVFTEAECVNRYGHSKRMDRLIVDEKEVIILDFKSSQEGHEEHVQQMREYMGMIASVYADKKIRGCLWYMDQHILEEMDG